MPRGANKLEKRNAEIVRRVDAGEAQTAVAIEFGISRQRVDQIVDQVKHAARARVADAIQKGVLVRPARCESCGADGDVDSHHRDYDRPLDVQWLCKMCHGVADRTRRDGDDTWSLSQAARALGVRKGTIRVILADVAPVKVFRTRRFYKPEDVRAARDRYVATLGRTTIPAFCDHRHELFPENLRINSQGQWKCLACEAWRIAEHFGNEGHSNTAGAYEIKATARRMGWLISGFNSGRVDVEKNGVRVRIGRRNGSRSWRALASVDGWNKVVGRIVDPVSDTRRVLCNLKMPAIAQVA